MPDDQNTGEWPEVQGRRISQVQDGYGFFVDDASEIDTKTARAFENSSKWETERYAPIHSIRERLEAEGAEAMARKEYELHEEEMGYESVWEEESEGYRDLWLDAAKVRITRALDAAFPEEER